MTRRGVGWGLLLGCILLAGCAPTEDRTVTRNNEMRIEETTVTRDSGAAHLSQLIEAAGVKIYEAESEDEFDAILDTLARNLAADATISDGALRQEKERMDSLNTQLHSGEMRVYPDKQTSAFIFGVPGAIAQALEIRAGGRSGTP